jgi:5-methylthioadenosine/S-adenosylhomocysteine deaminase
VSVPVTVVAHATVVTVDAHDTVVPDGAVAFDDAGVIVAVGPTATVLAAHPGTTVIDAAGGIVLPGLVNAHTHFGMTLLRGLADDLDLQGFLDRVVPIEAKVLSARTVAIGARLAFAESLRAGVTTGLDMFWWPEVGAAEASAAGFRLVNGPVFVGFEGPDGRLFDERMAWAESMLAARAPGDRWVFPHSTYTLGLEQLRAIAALAGRLGARVHVHASENAAEVAMVRERYGRSPIEVLDDVGMLGEHVVLAHAVALDDADLARIASTSTAVAHCPLSNLKLASGVCRVPELLAAGVTVGLGTDGCSSSNDLDVLLALRVAATLPKGVFGDATAVPAAAALRMATIDGARALGLGERCGSVEVGKQADLVLLDSGSPSLVPVFDPVSAVVYAAGRGDVTDVWVAGRRVVEGRALTTIDLPATVAAMRSLQAEVAAAGGASTRFATRCTRPPAGSCATASSSVRPATSARGSTSTTSS